MLYHFYVYGTVVSALVIVLLSAVLLGYMFFYLDTKESSSLTIVQLMHVLNNLFSLRAVVLVP